MEPLETTDGARDTVIRGRSAMGRCRDTSSRSQGKGKDQFRFGKRERLTHSIVVEPVLSKEHLTKIFADLVPCLYGSREDICIQAHPCEACANSGRYLGATGKEGIDARGVIDEGRRMLTRSAECKCSSLQNSTKSTFPFSVKSRAEYEPRCFGTTCATSLITFVIPFPATRRPLINN
jgi:hypothetical protein